MATEAQILANQQNSKLSTGPVTAEGKTASSTNAVKHGLSAVDPVLPHEDRAQFHQLLDQYRADWSPESTNEEFLIKQMAGARWKLDRIERLELELLVAVSDGDAPATSDAGIVEGLMDKNKARAFALLERHRTTLERTYYRALRELRLASKERLAILKEQNEAIQAEAERAQAAAAAARLAEKRASLAGFERRAREIFLDPLPSRLPAANDDIDVEPTGEDPAA